MRVVKIMRSLVIVAAFVVVGIGIQAPQALAAQPWWQVSIDSAPGVIQPGRFADEVQEVTVKATAGTFALKIQRQASGEPEFAWNATHQQVQEGLEGIYGSGNVEVPSGQGNATGSDPYRIVWKGDLAGEPIDLLGLERLEGTVKELVKGRDDATLVITAANQGDASTSGPVTLAVKLPSGLKALSVHGVSGQIGLSSAECSVGTLSCVYGGSVFPYGQIEMYIPVAVQPGASIHETVEAAASGGGAVSSKNARTLTVGDTPESFGAENYEVLPEEEGGGLATQAGSHPFQLTTNIMLNQRSITREYGPYYTAEPVESTKDLKFKLPPGLIGNPTPFPQCSLTQFAEGNNPGKCPNDTAVGVASVTIALGFYAGEPTIFSFATPVFNLTPSAGEPARFGFYGLVVPVFLDTSVRTGGDYGVTVSVNNITQSARFIGSRVTLWGVPGDPRHDGQRGWSCVGNEFFGGPCASTSQKTPPPLLELPTSCTGPLQTMVEADSWSNQDALVPSGPSVPLPAMDGCNRLPFNPSISVAPDGQAGSTPTGLTVGIHVPQDVSLVGEGLGEADVKDTTVALPDGVALNPSGADGLQACSEEQVGLSVDAQVSCPEASKVGTLEIKSPLLPNPLKGEAYLAAQTQNPFGSLVALYLVAEDPVSGTLIKLAGEVKLDPVTGQLVSTFKNTPQLPFEDFTLHFFGGDRAPLSTPAACGSYTTSASIAPWSGNPPAEPTSTFNVTSGPNGSPCKNPLGFSPSLTAGTTSIQAGGFTPFTMTVGREDGQQGIQQLQLHLPPGLSGLLTGVELCPEANANAGTCGPNSLIGETTVSVGLGGDPYSVSGGKVYVTGPYEGAPFGISVVVPAKAGPYNLGQVVVRGRIEVDPITSALTVTTNTPAQGYAIPHILDGIPLQVKHVNFVTTRQGFTFNPTNCDRMSVTGSVQSVEGATSPVSVPFQVTNCATLGFKPGLAVSTSAHTSRQNGASLHVKLTYPKAPFGSQANIKEVKVDLPHQLPSRLGTLQRACPHETFEANPAACSSASKVGFAKAVTPLIPVPLEGPAYFVSYGGEQFPELIVVLQGYGVTVDLHGETFINEKTGVTSSTFHTVPDVPVGTFELTLPQGRFSALGANTNLCKVKGGLKMPTLFLAQNGAQIKQTTKIAVSGCPRPHKKSKAHRSRAAAHAHGSGKRRKG